MTTKQDSGIVRKLHKIKHTEMHTTQSEGAARHCNHLRRHRWKGNNSSSSNSKNHRHNRWYNISNSNINSNSNISRFTNRCITSSTTHQQTDLERCRQHLPH